MASKKTHDVVATIGTYKDRNTGEEKKRYLNVGACFVDDDGRRAIKLESVPVGKEWSGWLSLYPVKKDDQPPARHEERSASMEGVAASDVDGDDIPF